MELGAALFFACFSLPSILSPIIISLLPYHYLPSPLSSPAHLAEVTEEEAAGVATERGAALFFTCFSLLSILFLIITSHLPYHYLPSSLSLSPISLILPSPPS